MSKFSIKPNVVTAFALAVAFGSVSFPSQAALSSLIPGMGSKKCAGSAGTLRIVEPDDGMGAWATYGLPAPTRMLRVMVNDSKCFTVLDRGVGFAAAQAERELALAGHLQEGQNIGAGQMRGADYVLIPDIVSQNLNAGGSQIGGSASTGQKRGLMGGMLNVATLGLAGRMSSNKQTAEVVLTLVDVRTSEQVVSVSGDAKITDRAWSAMVEASNVQGKAGVRVGTWENTEIGKVIMEAYDEAFNQMVGEIQKRGGSMTARNAPQAMMPAQLAASVPNTSRSAAASSNDQMGQGAAVLSAVGQVAQGAAGLVSVDQMGQGAAVLSAVGQAAQNAGQVSADRVGQASAALSAARQVAQNATELSALPQAAAQQVVASIAPQAVAAANGQAGASKLAGGGTLALRRTARLLAAASSQAETVAELATGMLVFPTGNTQGSMLEVEDEMGNKGWVPSAAVSAAG